MLENCNLFVASGCYKKQFPFPTLEACMFSRITLIFSLVLIFSVSLLAQPRSNRPVITRNPEAQDLRPHERGYRPGYEDGYDHGKEDFNRDQPRDFTASNDYQSADKNYDQRMGRIEEYQDGYRAGFELGYNDGYFGRSFSGSIPKNLTTIVVGAGTVASRDSRENQENRREQENIDPRNDRRNYPRGGDRNESAGNGQRIPQTNNRQEREETFSIPSGDQLRIRLTSPLNSKTNREGDQFTARVVSPSAYVNATIVGHITRISHSGKATGKTEMQFAFEEITMPDGRSAPLEAMVEKVYDSSSVKTVDEEGNVQSGTRTRDTATRGAGGAAIGAAIGAIAGGGKGAAIGAVIGGAAGAGSVYAQSGKDMILDVGTEMMIRTSGRGER
jgi:hypothetical protein